MRGQLQAHRLQPASLKKIRGRLCRLARLLLSKHWATGSCPTEPQKTLILMDIWVGESRVVLERSGIQTCILDSGRVEVVLLNFLIKRASGYPQPGRRLLDPPLLLEQYSFDVLLLQLIKRQIRVEV